tara:strand:- start:961 stop:1515 length:555 start_codon:yes stop_codon:yes gene_type:complete
MWLSKNDEHIARVFDALDVFLRGVIHDISLEHVLNQSFLNQSVQKKSTSKDGLDSLKVYKCDDTSCVCSICQDNFNIDDEILELPCGHKFHGEGCECPGLLPWLKDNNTCPMCKHELPSEDGEPQDSNENEIPDISQSIQNSIDDIKGDILMDLVNGESISVHDITSDNMNLMDRIRSNIQNSI